MAEEFQQSGAQAPEVAIQQASGEINQLTGGGDGSGGAAANTLVGNAQDAMADGVMAAVAGGMSPIAKVASFFIAGADGASGGSSPSQKQSPVSRFMGAVHSHTPKPMVPMSYGEMKTAAKRAAKWGGQRVRSGSIFVGDRYKDLKDQLSPASQSLTGSSTADGKKTPIKGAKVAQAAVERLATVTRSLSAALHAKEGVNRYDGSSARLEADLENNKPLARKVVQVNAANVKPPGLSSMASA